MSDWFDPGPVDGEDGQGDDVVPPADDVAGDGDGGPRANVNLFAPDEGGGDDPLPDVGEADEDGDAFVDADTQVVDDVGLVVGSSLVEPWSAVSEPDELADGDLRWWTGAVSVAAELLEAWPAAPGFDAAALSDRWTSGFDLEPVPGFADPGLLGAAEPPPSWQVEGDAPVDDAGGGLT